MDRFREHRNPLEDRGPALVASTPGRPSPEPT